MTLTTLRYADPVRIDTTRLNRICDEMGPKNGEMAICAAMEDVAGLVHAAATAYDACDLVSLGGTARQIIGLSERIGLTGLSQVASAVAELCEGSDDAALAATVARLLRVSEQSLIAIWQAQDVSV